MNQFLSAIKPQWFGEQYICNSKKFKLWNTFKKAVVLCIKWE